MFTSRPLPRYVPMLLAMGILFCLSQLPGDITITHLENGVDKLIHGALYALLAGTVIYGQRDRNGLFPFRTATLSLVVCVLYGLLDEWHQSFVRGRDASGWDLLADGVGALVAITIWLWQMRRRTSKVRAQAENIAVGLENRDSRSCR